MLRKIPVIDIFAGPGGLSEGFSRFQGDVNFNVKLSIEKDPVAHQTLLLRAFVRQFEYSQLPEAYYQYLRNEIQRDKLFKLFPEQAEAAKSEAWLAELGTTPRNDVHRRIRDALNGADDWLLIGGPPCQAYSMAGRSRMLGKFRSGLPEKYQKMARELALRDLGDDTHPDFSKVLKDKEAKLAEYAFHKDLRHKLYKEYLEIVAVHQPTVFVMENVKGLASSKLNSRYVLDYILSDLQEPWEAVDKEIRTTLRKPETVHHYRIFSFVIPSDGIQHLRRDQYVINSEDYGVPQKRHRLILLGVRDDVQGLPDTLNRQLFPTTVRDAIGDLPPLRSHLSRRPDREKEWLDSVREAARTQLLPIIQDKKVRAHLAHTLDHLNTENGVGGSFLPIPARPKGEYGRWVFDERLGGVIQHRARGHMISDMLRYLFHAATAEITGVSPTLYDYPVELLPDHQNTNHLQGGLGKKAGKVAFQDRFRAQVADLPATTITSHISKDGHYYIHYDTSQCRSLTPREAARIQTFPDNYKFEGNRTQQYHQVGNAVPPFLAVKLAAIVAPLFR